MGIDCACGFEIGASLAAEAAQKSDCVVTADLNWPFPLRDNSLTIVAAFNLTELLTETELFLAELHRVEVPAVM